MAKVPKKPTHCELCNNKLIAHSIIAKTSKQQTFACYFCAKDYNFDIIQLQENTLTKTAARKKRNALSA